MPVQLVVDDSPGALLDEPFAVRARAPEGTDLQWRARYRDDGGRVWRAAGSTPDELTRSWQPAKDGTGPVAALASLRPVQIDVRVEAGDGAAASRTLTRRFVAEGVRIRRWRDGPRATLHLPAEPEPVPPLVLDATTDPDAATLAAPLLASRGLLVLAVLEGDVTGAPERLAAVPSATGEPRIAGPPVLPPNVGTRDGDAAERIAAWDALLAEAGARPRRPA